MNIRDIKNEILNDSNETIATQPAVSSQIKTAMEAPKPAAPEVKLAKRRETISFNYIMDDGETRKAVLVSSVLDGEGRNKMSRIQMALTGGVSFDSLPAEERGRITCLARIAVQVEKCPDWVLDKASEDLELCYELATRLVDHETRFFRSDDGTSEEPSQTKRFSFN